nr:Methyl-CpG-binding domain-containing protein [Ipomoea batatas]
MVAGKSPEPLPPGWIEHVQVKNGRTIKYYTNGENGKKIYSRKAVINLVKAGDVNHGQNQGINNGETQSQGIGNGDGQNQGINNGDVPNQGTPKPENRRSKRSTTSPSPSSKLASKTDQSSDWLPPGWTVELKTRSTGLNNGSTYKCYVSPSGRKLYSKTQVSQFLNSAANINTPISNENKNNIEESSSNLEVPQNQTPKENQTRASRKRKSGMDKQTPTTVSPTVAAQDISADGLPAGWIKELRERACPSGIIRKDPYYIDPVSGYEFRSKRDVMRYLETGDIKKCVIKPKKRDESTPKDIHHNIEESSSKLEVSQNHKSVEDNSHISKRRKSVVDKSPAKIVSPVAVQNDSTGELPPGWIKEYKTRRLAHGIRKDPYYTDPVSGYVFRSKKDAFRYIETGDISKCAMKPTKRELGATSTDISYNTGKPSPKLKVSKNKKSMKVKRHVAKKQKSGIGKRPAKVVSNAEVQTGSVDGLPEGWSRELRPRRCGTKSDPYYIDPVSGFEFRSKRDALRYLETGDIAKCIMKPTKREPGSAFNDKPLNIEESASKLEEPQNNTSGEDLSNISKKRQSHPTKIAVQNSVDGLPAGWIKEIRTRTHASGGMREDPFYIDPVSGYVFRSKKDALRYLETGDIGKCVMKPSKRVPGSTVNDISTPDTDTKKEESGSWTRRQLFAGEELKGKEGADPTDAAPTQAEGSNKRRRSITQDFLNASPEAEVNTVKTPRRRASKGSRAKPTPNALNGDASAPQSMTKTRQPRKTKAPSASVPGRTSKRLAQNKQEVETNLGLNDEGALQAGIVNSSGIEVNTSISPPSSDPAPKVVANTGFVEQAFQSAIPNSGGIDINTSWGPNDPVQKVVADLGLGEEILQGSVMNTSGIDVNTSLAPTPSNPAPKVPQYFDANKPTTEVYHDCLGDEPLFPAENRGIPGKQVVGPHDDDVDMNLPLPVPNPPQPQYRSGECWSDPCLDFALKTLTGGMSAENPQDHPRGAPQHQQHQQQQQQFDPPYTQGDRCFKLPVFDSSRLHPNDPSPHSGSLDKQVSAGSQSPMNSPLLPPGFGIPTYSSMGSQQSGLDARKDYHPPNL